MHAKSKKPINEVLANSIAQAMQRKHITSQEQLARMSGLSSEPGLPGSRAYSVKFCLTD